MLRANAQQNLFNFLELRKKKKGCHHYTLRMMTRRLFVRRVGDVRQ